MRGASLSRNSVCSPVSIRLVRTEHIAGPVPIDVNRRIHDPRFNNIGLNVFGLESF